MASMSRRSCDGSTSGRRAQRRMSSSRATGEGRSATSCATGLPARVIVNCSPRCARSTTSPPWLRRSRIETSAMVPSVSRVIRAVAGTLETHGVSQGCTHYPFLTRRVGKGSDAAPGRHRRMGGSSGRRVRPRAAGRGRSARQRCPARRGPCGRGPDRVGGPARTGPRSCRPPVAACRRVGVEPDRGDQRSGGARRRRRRGPVRRRAGRVGRRQPPRRRCRAGPRRPAHHRGPVGVAPDPDGISRLGRRTQRSVAGPPRVGRRAHAASRRTRRRTPRPHRHPDARLWSSTPTAPATIRSPPPRSSTPSSRRSTPSPTATVGSAGSSSAGCSTDARA